MTDWEKTLYDDLSAEEVSGGWDQVNYPASIEYTRQNENTRINNVTNKILLQVEQGNSTGIICTTALNIYEEVIVHIYITVRNPQNTILQNRQYLKEVIEELISWYQAKAYTNIQYLGSYRDISEDFKRDIWFKCHDYL